MNPLEVQAMSCRKFADLQERMFLQNERRRIMNAPDDTTDDSPREGWSVYQGPKNRKKIDV